MQGLAFDPLVQFPTSSVKESGVDEGKPNKESKLAMLVPGVIELMVMLPSISTPVKPFVPVIPSDKRFVRMNVPIAKSPPLSLSETDVVGDPEVVIGLGSPEYEKGEVGRFGIVKDKVTAPTGVPPSVTVSVHVPGSGVQLSLPRVNVPGELPLKDTVLGVK